MSSWLGIGIFVAFSVVLTLFMRLERRPGGSLPPNLGRWERYGEPSAGVEDGVVVYEERRLWLHDAKLWCGSRLVEQRRIRRASDHEIVEVLPERPVRKGSASADS